MATALGLEPRHRITAITGSFQDYFLSQLGLGCQIAELFSAVNHMGFLEDNMNAKK